MTWSQWGSWNTCYKMFEHDKVNKKKGVTIRILGSLNQNKHFINTIEVLNGLIAQHIGTIEAQNTFKSMTKWLWTQTQDCKHSSILMTCTWFTLLSKLPMKIDLHWIPQHLHFPTHWINCL